MEYNELKVTNANKKEKIYSYLKRNGFSENYVKNLRKKEGYILLNDQIAHSDHIVNNGDVLKLYKNPNAKSSIMQVNLPLDIVYENDDFIVINKPSGLTTSASKSHYDNNLSGAVLAYMVKSDPNFVVRIIGRLDKDTSGLIVVAKHSIVSNILSQKDVIKKTYFALAAGKIDKEILVDKNILTTQNEMGYNNLKREISPLGKPAITYVKPIAFDGENTLCKINIDYGRTHQIRVHMSSINHPLLGDEVYGTKSKKINHTALTCSEIDFELFGVHYNFSVPLADDIKRVFNNGQMCLA